MISPRQLVVRLFVVGCLLCGAFGAGARAQVYITNETDEEVKIVDATWTTLSGKSESSSGPWTFAPGERAKLLSGGREIMAREFQWRNRTAKGETPARGRVWVRKLAANGGRGLEIRIRNGEIPYIAGQVKFSNKTNRRIVVRELAIMAPSGRVRTLSGYWTLDPNESCFLVEGNPGRRLMARRVSATLVCNGSSTRWKFTDTTGDDGVYLAECGESDLGPPASWQGRLESGKSIRRTFSSSNTAQTLVFRLQNRAATGDVDIFVRDRKGRVVARSSYGGAADDRCVLHTVDQERYTVTVKAAAGRSVDFRVAATAISHSDILAEAIGQEGGKALAVGLLVELFGSDDEKSRYWNSTLSGAAQDAVALTLIEGLMQAQREKPALDPLSREFRGLVTLLGQGGEFISVRKAFLDGLMKRIERACRR